MSLNDLLLKVARYLDDGSEKSCVINYQRVQSVPERRASGHQH